MGVHVIIDIVIFVILVLFIWRGGHRGLVRSLAGLLSLIIAFAGAGYIATHYSDTVAEKMKPYLTEMVGKKLQESGAADVQTDSSEDEVVSPETNDSENSSDAEKSFKDAQLEKVSAALKKMGLYDGIAKTLSVGIAESVNSIGTALTTAVTDSLSGTISYILLFVISFVLILLVLKLLMRLLDLLFRVPGLHFFNTLGGGILGLLQGILILFLVAWILRFMGTVIPEEVVKETVLLRFFMETNPITLLTGI